jgi:hypothetical protein
MTHPYKSTPTYRKWRTAISNIEREFVDPVVDFPFCIEKNDLVATAGSCFAQHIARNLVNNGFRYYIEEEVHPFANNVGGRNGYELFSARYGNIYTSRQLLQLILRARGVINPTEEVWRLPDGSYVDPYRPTVQPKGFISLYELESDRRQHLTAVLNMLKNMDYFVYTLGLTEFWSRKSDGIAFPVCPGVAGGAYNPDTHVYNNLGVNEVVSDITEAWSHIKQLNKRARMILTVSPVALAATAENKHVLLANTYSKSVLRVAADIIVSNHTEDIAYFPSFEIIQGPHSRGGYLNECLREVNPLGVQHVMNLFIKHATNNGKNTDINMSDDVGSNNNKLNVHDEILKVLQAECDEALLGL